MSSTKCSRPNLGWLRPSRRRVFHELAILACCLLLASCGEGEQPVQAVSVRDSVGIRIVEYDGVPTPAGTASISAAPIYRYGEQPEHYPFQLIWLGALQPDGSAIIVDTGSREVVRVEMGGGAHSILARNGQGPNEVRWVSGVFVLGQDTILLEDDGNARFAVFESGTATRSTSTMGDRSLTGGLRTYGVAPDGDLLMGTSSYRPGFADPWLPGQLVRLNLETLAADTIGQYDLVPFGARDGLRNPFMPSGHIDAAGDDFIVARSDRPELEWRGADGATRQVLRWRPEPRYPGEADLDQFKELRRGVLRRVNPQYGGDALEAFLAERLSRYEIVEDRPLPVFATIQVDDVRRVWLAHFDAAGNSGGAVPGYSIVGPDGIWLAEFTSPASFRLLDVAFGRVLGMVTDELDVQHIVVFDLDIS